jgi:hypothetical protein
MLLTGAAFVGAITVVASTVFFFGGGKAFATTTPPWEPDAANEVGTIALYDSSGTQISGGSTQDSPISSYAVASAAGRTGDTKATLFLCTPQVGVNPANWSCDQLSLSTDYPPASGPLASSTLPVVSGASGDETVEQENADFPNNSTTTGYQNVYQLRIWTSGPGQAQGAQYDAADILVDSTAKTWTQIYPAVTGPAPKSTSTTLTVSPASPQLTGTDVTLTASVSTSSGSPAGTVKFFDGATQIGADQAYSGSGTVSVDTTTLSVGTHTLKATFTPTDSTAFQASQSTTTSYVINSPAATPTTTTLAVTPPSPVEQGTSTTLTATVSPTAAVGSVAFMDGSTTLKSATVSSGTATFSTSSLAPGTHSLSAKFTPTDLTAYAASTSSTASYSVTAKPVTKTTTTLGVSPGSPSKEGTTLNLTGTVKPSAAPGSIAFYDGSVKIGTHAVSGGSASYAVKLAVGAHTLTAHYVPAASAAYAGSVSLPVPYTITSTSSGGSSSNNSSDVLGTSSSKSGSSGSSGSNLPTTGLDIALMSLAGLIVVVAGMVMYGAEVVRPARGRHHLRRGLHQA